MIYYTRPKTVQVEHWTDLDNPPLGIYDLWTAGPHTYGYLPMPRGEKLAWLGCFLIVHENGYISVVSEEELNKSYYTEEK